MPIEEYPFSDDRVGEKGYYDLSTTFPISYDNDDEASYYKGLRFTPAGHELVIELGKHIVDTHNLGRNGTTDVLTLSLSEQDYIGHAWGTFSVEYVETTSCVKTENWVNSSRI
ncbi:MAG: hypothetical protein U5P41_12840 [Gammaproteobacteria bacterium]|nr:hypothetical protein [Gammaproteobacteria bacterium]